LSGASHRCCRAAAIAGSRYYSGQSIFTPKNLSIRPPDPRDRPYAGWLYIGASLLQQTDHRMLENLELDAGVVGPGSLAKQVQNDFHQFIGVAQARGWSSQLQNEPGVMLSYERLWRVALPLVGDKNQGIDIVPQLGATAGNIMTYGEIGGLLRLGKGCRPITARSIFARLCPAPTISTPRLSAAITGSISLSAPRAAPSGTTSFSTATPFATAPRSRKKIS
jgi:Uncharacterized protein conserved in bacteria (DUF2219)